MYSTPMSMRQPLSAIILYNEDSCRIYNMSGTEKFDATFDFPVSKIRKGRFPGTLVVTGPQQMQELKLR